MRNRTRHCSSRCSWPFRRMWRRRISWCASSTPSRRYTSAPLACAARRSSCCSAALTKATSAKSTLRAPAPNSLPVFDGGARQAEVDRAGAGYEEDVAKYRQTVLNAFGEVEDNLATLRILGDQTHAQDEAVNASARAANLSHIQYREGSISYLNVIDADRSVLQQQRVAVQLDGERARSTVNLIRAIGGGWGEPARLE